MKRIHIVGTGPRTGTTLICELMAACFNIPYHTDHEDRIFKDPPARDGIFLTKCPKDILVIKPILALDHNLYVICMIRDPRDSICSKHGEDPTKYWAGLRYWKTYSSYWEKLNNHSRVISLKYEDLVSNPDETQKIIMKHWPWLQKTHAFSSYHKIANVSKDSLDALGGVRPISPTTIGNWKNHLPRIAGQIKIHGSISDDLIKHNYESDDTWINLLNNIEPDLSPGHFPEFFTKKEIHRLKKGLFPHLIKIALRKIIDKLHLPPKNQLKL